MKNKPILSGLSILCILALAGLYFTGIGGDKATPPIIKVVEKERPPAFTPMTATPAEIPSTEVSAAEVAPVEAEDVDPIVEEAPPAILTRRYGPGDFSWGEMRNITDTGGLRLAGGTPDMSAEPGFRLAGEFESEIVHREGRFDTVTFNHQGSVPPGSTLVFEVRTILDGGGKSKWTEIPSEELGQPLALEKPVIAWQYRFSFFADDFSRSPFVQSVDITTYSNSTMASSAGKN